MKKAILAVLILSASASAVAAPAVGSAYDRIQDARTSVIEQDLNGAKLGVVVVNNDLQDYKAAQAIRDNKQDALITTAGSKADAALAGVAANGAALTGKVDTTKFTADQQRQDDAAAQAIRDQADTDRAQDHLTAQLHADTTQKLASKVDDSVFQQRAADLDLRIAEGKAAQQKTNQTVAQHTATLANHEARITDLEQQTNSGFKDLRNQIDKNKDSANAGIAGVAAMAAIPQVLESQTFNVGAGVGNRDDQQAIAVGFSARASQSVVVKASVAADTDNGFTVGAGVAYGW